MKKTLLAVMLSISIGNTFANMLINQGNWRWRKDDGTETSATWIANQNTVAIISSYTEPLRLRFEIYNDPVNMGSVLTDIILQASDNGSTWDTVNLVDDGDDAFVLAGTSSWVSDLDPTSQQLTSPHSGTFVAGQEIVSSEKLPSASINSGSETEYEYVIKPTSNLQPSTTYYFRISPANYIIATPELNTTAVLPVRLIRFLIAKEGKQVKLNWSTAFEQNTGRFEVERSNNGRDWVGILRVKSSGSSNSVQSYDTYDGSPLKGTNYYRLKLFDLDEHFSFSEVKSIKFEETLRIVEVSPNPSKGIINFKLRCNVNKVSVSLTNTNGSQIYQTKFDKVDVNKRYSIHLPHQPAAGIYFLNLKSDDINETTEVVIQ